MGPEAYRIVVDSQRQDDARTPPSATAERAPCPYCGALQAPAARCSSCGGVFEPLSRQASQNQMGPWCIRDERHPFRPGCSYETLVKLATRGAIDGDTVIRGPSTRQFWTLARNTPGVANLIGECHACHEPAGADEFMCARCGAVFTAPEDRQTLGLGPVRLLPGQAAPDVVARSSIEAHAPRPAAQQPDPAVTHQTPPPPPPPGAAASALRPARLPEPAQTPFPEPRVDATNALTAANRRLRRRMEKMRLVLAGLVAINILLLLIVAVMLSPRIGFAPAGNGAQRDAQTAPLQEGTPQDNAGAGEGAADDGVVDDPGRIEEPAPGEPPR